MKTIIDMRLVCQGQSKAIIRREIDSDMVPFPGLTIEHDHASEIQNVCYNLETDSYYVVLKPEDHFESKEELETQIEGYKEYGWTVLGE